MGARRALVAVAAVALAAGAAARAAVPGAAGGKPAAIVSLGDSFISGEGAGGGYGASAANGCHRSRTAPIRSAPVPVARRANLACSGARAENVWRAVAAGRAHRGEPPQADRLAAVARTHDVRMVVLTVGANDFGFSRLVVRCALSWAAGPLAGSRRCRHRAGEKLTAALPTAERSLRKAIREVRRAMAGTGQRLRSVAGAAHGTDLRDPGDRPGYRLVVMGYASPIPRGVEIRYPQRGWARLTEGGCPLWDEDADWARREAVPAIVAMMRSAAAGTGAEFLDVSEAFDGHEACSRRAAPAGTPFSVPWVGRVPVSAIRATEAKRNRSAASRPVPAARAEWMRGLDLCCERSPRESLHPNRHGQRALGACLGLAYAAPPGDHVCRTTPGKGYATGMYLDP